MKLLFLGYLWLLAAPLVAQPAHKASTSSANPLPGALSAG